MATKKKLIPALITTVLCSDEFAEAPGAVIIPLDKDSLDLFTKRIAFCRKVGKAAKKLELEEFAFRGCVYWTEGYPPILDELDYVVGLIDEAFLNKIPMCGNVRGERIVIDVGMDLSESFAVTGHCKHSGTVYDTPNIPLRELSFLDPSDLKPFTRKAFKS